MPILFDLDGTLVDPREGIFASLRYALEKLGRVPPDDTELESVIGPPLHVSLASLLGSSDEDEVWAGVAAYRDEFGRVGVTGNTVYPGIEDALASLAAIDGAMFVATSKPVVYASKIINLHGFSRYFRGVYGAELDDTRSDKSSLIADVLRCENIDPHRCIMVGDRSHDAVGALANGVHPAGVLWGFGSRQELSAAGVTTILSHPPELRSLSANECVNSDRLFRWRSKGSRLR